jgi:HEAT repeat protein
MNKLLTHIQPGIVPAGTFYSHRLSMGLPGSGACFAPDEKGAGGGDMFVGGPVIDSLIRAFRKFDWRDDSVEKLAQMGEKAIPALIGVLKTKKTTLLEPAAEALTRIGQPTVEPMMEIYESVWSPSRKLILKAFGAIGDKRVTELVMRSLYTKNYELGTLAADTLGQLGDLRVMEPLMRYLSTDNLIQFRGHAARALGALGDKRAVGVLKREFGKLLLGIRFMTELEGAFQFARALTMLDAPPIDELKEGLASNKRKYAARILRDLFEDETLQARSRASDSLGEIVVDMVEPLVRGFKKMSTGYLEDKHTALTSACKGMTEYLGNQNYEVMAELLTYIDERAHEPLSRLLGDTNRDIRRYAFCWKEEKPVHVIL